MKCISLHNECWKQRCVTLDDPSSQKIMLQKDAKVTKIEAISG